MEQVKRSKLCGTCHGNKVVEEKKTLSVKVPAGIETGLRLRVGEEEEGENGGPAGDLYVFLSVAESDKFIREGNDVILPHKSEWLRLHLVLKLKSNLRE